MFGLGAGEILVIIFIVLLLFGAKKLLIRVIEIHPQHADAHYNLGNIYKYYRDLKKAKLHMKKQFKFNRIILRLITTLEMY